MLEPSGSQKAPNMEPKRIPNPALEAIPSEKGKTLIFNDNITDFNDFSCLRAPFWHQTWVQNGFRIASSMLWASESLLARILDAIIALLEPSSALLRAIRWPKGEPTNSTLSTSAQQQPAERGGERINLSQGLGIGCLDSKKIAPNVYTP